MFKLPSNKPIEYIPKRFRKEDNPPIFLVKPASKDLVLSAQSTLASVSMDKAEADISLLKVMQMCLSECIVGWKNIYDEDGKIVEFNQENFERLNDQEILMELYLYIQDSANGDEKNDEVSTTTATS